MLRQRFFHHSTFYSCDTSFFTLFPTYFLLSVVAQPGFVLTEGEKAPVYPEVTVDQSGVQNCVRRPHEPLRLHHQSHSRYVSLRCQICRYRHFVGSLSDFGSNFVGFETKLAGNAATRASMRPSTAVGLGGGCMSFSRFPKRCSYLTPALYLGRDSLALRSLHSSKPTCSNDAPLFSTNPNEPITTIAERGSTQLSVREPQNKAGMSGPVIPNSPMCDC